MALIARIAHDTDPREAIFKELGDLSGFDIAAQGVLVATYTREGDAKIAGTNLIMPEAAVKDDQFQSKTGLVVRLGRRAFKEDQHVQWHGFSCGIGDWVVFRASDGLKMQVPGMGGIHCRLIADVHLKMKIPNPDAVF